jgi:hypothetical protein
MASITEQIDFLTGTVLNGSSGLNEALSMLETWLQDHADQLAEADRRAFSAALEANSSQDNRSLIDSVLKLHAARLLHRYDAQPQRPAGSYRSTYEQTRDAFQRAMEESERILSESRIDIVIANAHHLLGDVEANRLWLSAALEQLPELAATDLVAMAQDIPPIPLPQLNPLQRLTFRLIAGHFSRLAQQNRESLAAIAQLQINQTALLAHLIGTSFEAINEQRQAQRAYRVAAYLIVRYQGLPGQDPATLLEMAETLWAFEDEAAQILARQALSQYQAQGNTDGIAQAQALLEAHQGKKSRAGSQTRP